MNKRLMMALVGLIAALAAMFYIFDMIQIVDVRGVVLPWLIKLPVVGEHFRPPQVDNYALVREELENQKEALELRDVELNERETQLLAREEELNQKDEELQFRQTTLDRKESEFQLRMSRFDEEETRYQKLVEYLSNMQPTVAAQKLAAVDGVTGEPKINDETVVQILYRMESATAGIILSYMPDERASVLIRKIGS